MHTLRKSTSTLTYTQYTSAPPGAIIRVAPVEHTDRVSRRFRRKNTQSQLQQTPFGLLDYIITLLNFIFFTAMVQICSSYELCLNYYGFPLILCLNCELKLVSPFSVSVQSCTSSSALCCLQHSFCDARFACVT